MAAVLAMYLKNAGYTDVVVESAGILEICKSGRGASPQCLVVAKRLGLDLSQHVSRQADDLDLGSYDLFVGVSEDVVTHLFKMKVPKGKLHNAQIPNPWPSDVQADHDLVAETVMGAMYRVVARYFPNAAK